MITIKFATLIIFEETNTNYIY